MQIKFLGTGSAGNAIVIQTESTTIMVDCGIPKTQIEKRLLKNDVNPADIGAIFLTHGHGDHIKGLPLATKWNIPVYASEGTWKSLDRRGKDGFMDIGSSMIREPFHITPFRTHHNDYDSFGYAVNGDDFKVSVCLDTGHISPDMIEAMKGSTHIIIESNHDVDMTVLSGRSDYLNARNLSDLGHLSNEQTAEALAKLVTGKGEHIYLAHLSSECNMPFLAKMVARNALLLKGFKMDQHYTLEVV